MFAWLCSLWKKSSSIIFHVSSYFNSLLIYSFIQVYNAASFFFIINDCFLIAGWQSVLHRYKSMGINWAFRVSQESLKKIFNVSHCFSQDELSHPQAFFRLFFFFFYCNEQISAFCHSCNACYNLQNSSQNHLGWKKHSRSSSPTWISVIFAQRIYHASVNRQSHFLLC